MYADRFNDGPRFRPTSLGAALVINGGVIAALLFANPELIPGVKPNGPLKIIEVYTPPPPPPDPVTEKQIKPEPRPSATTVTPRPEVETLFKSDNRITGTETITDYIDPGTDVGSGTGEKGSNPPIPPLFVAAREDPRYLADFQPPYPDYERDIGREDVVKLRVRIGVDGRVKQVERLGGRDSFARVAIAHALAKWRFKPATRGDVPEESWKVMTVRFTLNNG